MSLMWTLRKLVDPLEWLKEDEEKRSAREDKPGEPKDGGGGGVTIEEVPRPAESWACRICAHESTSGGYCPKCLADTMQRKR
jgi:hypothetical protein